MGNADMIQDLNGNLLDRDSCDDDRPCCADCGRVVGEDETPVTTDGDLAYYSCCVTPEQLAAHGEAV